MSSTTPYIVDGKRVSRYEYERAREDHFNLALPKGMLDQVKRHAAARGESTRGFIRRAIAETMERDGGGETGAAAAATE